MKLKKDKDGKYLITRDDFVKCKFSKSNKLTKGRFYKCPFSSKLINITDDNPFTGDGDPVFKIVYVYPCTDTKIEIIDKENNVLIDSIFSCDEDLIIETIDNYIIKKIAANHNEIVFDNANTYRKKLFNKIESSLGKPYFYKKPDDEAFYNEVLTMLPEEDTSFNELILIQINSVSDFYQKHKDSFRWELVSGIGGEYKIEEMKKNPSEISEIDKIVFSKQLKGF